MGKITIHFRGMHLFVFDDKPDISGASQNDATGVTVYAPTGGHHPHKWIVMADLLTKLPAAHWRGDFSLAIDDAECLCVIPDDEVVVALSSGPLPTAPVKGCAAVASRGISLEAAAGNGTVTKKIEYVRNKLTLSGGTLHVVNPINPALGKLWDVDGTRQCLADHVVWILDHGEASTRLSTAGRTYEFGLAARITCVNYPDHYPHDASHTAGVHSRSLTHIKALYEYVNGTKSVDVKITVDDCPGSPAPGGGGFPVECPYGWATR